MLDALKAKFVVDKAAEFRLCRGTIGADHSMHLAENRLDFQEKATSDSIGSEGHAHAKLITPISRRQQRANRATSKSDWIESYIMRLECVAFSSSSSHVPKSKRRSQIARISLLQAPWTPCCVWVNFALRLNLRSPLVQIVLFRPSPVYRDVNSHSCGHNKSDLHCKSIEKW